VPFAVLVAALVIVLVRILSAATLSTLIQRLSTVFSTPSTFTGKCALQNCCRGANDHTEKGWT
jgi:hypothetical protein